MDLNMTSVRRTLMYNVHKAKEEEIRARLKRRDDLDKRRLDAPSSLHIAQHPFFHDDMRYNAMQSYQNTTVKNSYSGVTSLFKLKKNLSRVQHR